MSLISTAAQNPRTAPSSATPRVARTSARLKQSTSHVSRVAEPRCVPRPVLVGLFLGSSATCHSDVPCKVTWTCCLACGRAPDTHRGGRRPALHDGIALQPPAAAPFHIRRFTWIHPAFVGAARCVANADTSIRLPCAVGHSVLAQLCETAGSHRVSSAALARPMWPSAGAARHTEPGKRSCCDL